MAYQNPLHEMTQTTPTCLWTDTAGFEELKTSIGYGAVGATCNPVIALSVIKKEMPFWKQRIQELVAAMPSATEDQIGWRAVEEMSIRGAGLLWQAFERDHGRNGRLSIQTDPRYFRDSAAIIEQAVHFSQLAPNMIVKIPATSSGIPAIEEVTYRGVKRQRYRLLHASSVRRRGRGSGARLEATREGRKTCRRNGPSLHHYGRSA